MNDFPSAAFDQWKTKDPADYQSTLPMASCPCCRSDKDVDLEEMGKGFAVTCSRCGMSGPQDEGQDEAITKWNEIMSREFRANSEKARAQVRIALLEKQLRDDNKAFMLIQKIKEFIDSDVVVKEP